MEICELLRMYGKHPLLQKSDNWIKSGKGKHLLIQGLNGSSKALWQASTYLHSKRSLLAVADDAEEAAYLFNDLRTLLSEEDVFLFPASYKSKSRNRQADAANEINRTETLNRLANNDIPCIIVSYPEAIMEKVVDKNDFQESTLSLRVDMHISTEDVQKKLLDFGFNRVDFVYEPGQFAIRGSIIDIFSYACENPYRIDFFGDDIESIRLFDIETQLSTEKKNEIEIIPDLFKQQAKERTFFFSYLASNCLYMFNDLAYTCGKIDQLYTGLSVDGEEGNYIESNELLAFITTKQTIELSSKSYYNDYSVVSFNTSYQPLFHKNFELIGQALMKAQNDGYGIYLLSDSKKQTDRIASIFEDKGEDIRFTPVDKTLHEGFMDHDLLLCCYTDHQLFERYHKVQLKTDNARRGKVILTLKELNQFKIGDYLVHIDHGVGKFGGLVRTNINGKMQEMVKLIYKDDDIIFVSIHSLHRISKYKGKEGEPPRINKLGSGAWERLKERTKSKVKDIARDLIQLYAKRKAEKGFRFSPDGYLQHELEASFLYEDTPDQVKATADFKKDMESDTPMDRLVCGDVGFGKTEIAMRAAFKAATDGKQVAVLVPTTVLALQHYHSFKERFKDMPCTVEYLSRARNPKETKEIVKRLEEGKIDIIIGTHKLVGKSIKFKDLGLLIIDEEQKFGVAVKEKLKQLKVNVDTMTLTATPIPRTLQFSLMGARDLSIINTPPPNRYPVQTELICNTDEDIIQEAIELEMNRNGQVFIINNRIHNLEAVKNMVQRLVPECRIAIGHGQMKPEELETILTDFVNYEYDVLIATAIIESGIDMPNVNTILINNAQNFGLSDLHQLRGRVGRSNRKAYCYLITPEMSLLTPEARRRLQAIETFSDLGSGFNIAMQDLDIRGAGNMLGAEQSGFIADLGYETYQKILNEAVTELKEEEFSDLYKEELEDTGNNTFYVSDCVLESDLELCFPAEYIENVSERISLYQELDNLNNESELETFKGKLIDRFGAIPAAGEDLMQALRLRWIAQRLGIEKLVLKGGKMSAFLVSNMNSSYYQSDTFGKLLRYAVNHPRQCQLREQNDKRSIVISNVDSVNKAWNILSEIEHEKNT